VLLLSRNTLIENTNQKSSNYWTVSDVVALLGVSDVLAVIS